MAADVRRTVSGATEAPGGFDNKTNGFSTQAQFDADRASFEERDDIARTLTFSESILRHAGEATFVTNNYRSLSTTQQNQIITFLKSL